MVLPLCNGVHDLHVSFWSRVVQQTAVIKKEFDTAMRSSCTSEYAHHDAVMLACHSYIGLKV